MSVKSQDLESNMDSQSRKAGLFGRSTFAGIQKALADYEKAGTPKEKVQLLKRMEKLCAQWLEEHSKDATDRQAGRLPLVRDLADELPAELASVSSKMQAEDIYMSNIANAGAKGGTDPGSKFALEALKGKDAAEKAPGSAGKALAKAKGLTPAEVAAIRIYTAADYTYINPASANAPEWLKSQKQKPELGLGGIANKTLTEEGSLHAGVAMQGLAKLKPWTKDTYRGARYTQKEFDDTFASGKPMVFGSFASSAQEERVALNFAHGIGIEYIIANDKEIAVLCILSSTGGKDISKLSAVQSEKEVLLLPGTSFSLVSLKQVDGNAIYGKLVKTAADRGQPIPKKWYVASLAPTPKKAKA
jgi:hypothetical protein